MSDKNKKPASTGNHPVKPSGERSVPQAPKPENLHIKPDINKSNNMPNFPNSSPRPPKTKE